MTLYFPQLDWQIKSKVSSLVSFWENAHSHAMRIRMEIHLNKQVLCVQRWATHVLRQRLNDCGSGDSYEFRLCPEMVQRKCGRRRRQGLTQSGAWRVCPFLLSTSFLSPPSKKEQKPQQLSPFRGNIVHVNLSVVLETRISGMS